MFAGGTYFRARDPGMPGNNISVEVYEYEPYTGIGTGEAYCVVTNRTPVFIENVLGPVKTTILDIKGSYADLWRIDQLDTLTPRARYYSISLRIAFQIQQATPYVLPAPTELGTFTIGKLFTDSGKLSVKTAENGSIFTPASLVSIAQRTRIYALSGIEVIPPIEFPGPTLYGWSIAALRAQVNAADPWIEMLERSGPSGDPPVPNPDPPDHQDDGADDIFLLPFSETNLANGDGLPDNPDRERTGPTRSIVKVNYGEQPNGKLGEHNKVYEWVGDSASAGTWKTY